MKTMFARIISEDAVLIASVTDNVGVETKVFRSEPSLYAIVRSAPSFQTVDWCRTPSALYFRLSKRLGSGDFALMSYRLWSKVR
ncbi:MAG TPA: hypothetical protein VG457_03445 [Planctomycetota bacterium]|jgi:hypothetical protein|nr:hypothetical protein [Planctomycetota bacterium]